MAWHIIEGAEGCAYAVERGCVAIVVDALRASATAAMLLHHGATEILAVTTIDEAHAAKSAWPDALLFGERGGLPPAGFDYGNSPREAVHARDRRVIFTTTTGAGRLVAAWGARAVYMASTVNAGAVVQAAKSHDTDVVIIPAGLMGEPVFDAQEDWVAATVIAMRTGVAIDEGRARFESWQNRIEAEGVLALFGSAPHAAKLCAVQLDEDIAYCAQEDITTAVPCAVEKNEFGVIVQNA